MSFRIPSWLSWYKKPEYRDIRDYATSISTGKRPMSPDRHGGIPSRLRLERILANKTCSPMSLYDFYMYLKYIEFSAENLEFYIWFKNYEAAWEKGRLNVDDKNYGALPSAGYSSSSVSRIKAGDSLANRNSNDDDGSDNEQEDTLDLEAARAALNRISFLIPTTAACGGSCAFPPPPPTPPNGNARSKLSRSQSTSASETTSLKVPEPSRTRPLSEDLEVIKNLFLLPNSPKELNIPPAMRAQALADLQRTQHPSALRPVADYVYSLLRNCSHRNFIRLGVGNGTFETVCVATVLGWLNLLCGFLVVFVRAFHPFRGAHTRWEAWAPWPLWWLGMTLVLSGLRGSCFFLLLFSRRQPLPWERVGEDAEGTMVNKDSRRRSGQGGGMKENKRLAKGFSVLATLKRLMIFDRRLKVQERHLRRLQRKIVFQSLVGGSIFATVCVLMFIFLPVWKETV